MDISIKTHIKNGDVNQQVLVIWWDLTVINQHGFAQTNAQTPKNRGILRQRHRPTFSTWTQERLRYVDGLNWLWAYHSMSKSKFAFSGINKPKKINYPMSIFLQLPGSLWRNFDFGENLWDIASGWYLQQMAVGHPGECTEETWQPPAKKQMTRCYSLLLKPPLVNQHG